MADEEAVRYIGKVQAPSVVVPDPATHDRYAAADARAFGVRLGLGLVKGIGEVEGEARFGAGMEADGGVSHRTLSLDTPGAGWYRFSVSARRAWFSSRCSSLRGAPSCRLIVRSDCFRAVSTARSPLVS